MDCVVHGSVPLPVGFWQSSRCTGPLALPNLLAWWKADSLGLANNDPVTTWVDSSCNGHDATQATSAKKPFFNTSLSSWGIGAVTFDGSDDTLVFPAITALTGDFTICTITRAVTVDGVLLASNDAYVRFRYATANDLVATFAGGAPHISSVLGVHVDSFSLIVFSRTGSALKYWQNNGVDVTGLTTTSATFGSFTQMGSFFESTLWFTGSVGEILFYNDYKSQATIQSLYTNYFAPKWSV